MQRLGTSGLGYGQIFLVIFGFLITSGLIFLFGIWVGRDIAERRLVQEERIVRVPMQPPPTPDDEAKQDVDRSFYENLKQKAYVRIQETVAAASATAPPSPPAADSGPLPTPALAAVEAAPAEAAPAAAAPAATPVPKAPPPAATATIRATPRPAASPAPTRTAAPQVARPTARPTPPAAATEPERTAGEGAEGAWTVQVSATTSIEQAVDLARRLKAKGYDAYTAQAPLQGQTWYRVRVGRGMSREQAQEIEARLKASEGLEGAAIIRQ